LGVDIEAQCQSDGGGMTQSALYVGRVMHKRFRPKAHRLSYACYWLLLDLDRLGDLAGQLRFFSHNRFNVFGVYDKDHGDGSETSLRKQIDNQLQVAGIDLNGGRIFLLTMPRILGFVFNPLSVYYCFDREDRLAALVYEVHNTFQQRHSYVFGLDPNGSTAFEHGCPKAFYVSPFLDMKLRYGFKSHAPRGAAQLIISVDDGAGPVLKASLAGQRRALTDRGLLRVFFTHPLVTAKVVAAIHLEALRLWWKGVKLVPRPEPPVDPTTYVSFDRSHKSHQNVQEII
jgi:uncharacterized protein